MTDTTTSTTSAPGAIDPASTIDEIIAHHPSSIAVLNAFGIDTCCGGGDSLANAAAHARVDVASLLAALQRVAAL